MLWSNVTFPQYPEIPVVEVHFMYVDCMYMEIHTQTQSKALLLLKIIKSM